MAGLSSTSKILARFVPKTLHSSLRLWLMEHWPDREPEKISDFACPSVVVLAPHPDDEVIGPGGTVRRHVLAGAAVWPVIITDGKFGGYDPDQTLVARRQEESRAAAKILGTREPIFLNAPDCALEETPIILQTLERLLSEKQTSIVYLPALTDNHRDHWATNRLLKAVLPRLNASVKNRLIIRGYEVWSPVLANCFADITAVAELKKLAIEAFPSQTKIDDYAGAVMGINRYRSLRGLNGHGYAEAFMQMTAAEFEKLYTAASLRE